MILADTSVWIAHLRAGDQRLGELLALDQVVMHPFVIGELACGNLRNRDEILARLAALPQTEVVEQREVLHLLQTRQLHGRGLGWVDAHLLGSAVLAHHRIWTLDSSLAKAAKELHCADLVSEST